MVESFDEPGTNDLNKQACPLQYPDHGPEVQRSRRARDASRHHVQLSWTQPKATWPDSLELLVCKPQSQHWKLLIRDLTGSWVLSAALDWDSGSCIHRLPPGTSTLDSAPAMPDLNLWTTQAP